MPWRISCNGLAAASNLLRWQRRSPGFDELSRGITSAPLRCLSAAIPLDHLVQANDLISSTPWATQGETSQLLDMPRKSPTSTHQRAALQKSRHILQRSSAHKRQFDFSAKLTCFAGHTRALGCRHPSEPTSAFIAAILPVCTEGVAKARAITPGLLRVVFSRTKRHLKALCRGRPLEVIIRTPAMPQQLRTELPRTCAVVFGPSSPGVCPIRTSDATAVVQQMPQRSSRACMSRVRCRVAAKSNQ